MSKYRIEHDLLGEVKIPEDAYWGIHTERARYNFSVSGYSVNPSLIKAMAMVKRACCMANQELGYLEEKKAKAIMLACDEIVEGRSNDQFPIDALQGGAGTSTNMNINEVIANRAIEILGKEKGNYSVIHPLEDVNLHQSTNDTYPTAVKIACIYGFRNLNQAIAKLQGAFQKKEKEFGKIVKLGRTELQEAVPLTLGAEFSGFSEAISRDRWRTFKCEERMRVVNLGGTAIGTGLTAPREYIFLVNERLRDITGLGLTRGENVVGETANADAFVEVSGIMKAHATNLIKISNDLRLLNFLGEIKLPSVQAGSSIMPGKVNPVILEMVIQVGMKVMANDSIVAETASRGTLQINEFLPLLTHAIYETMDILINTNLILAEHIAEIKAYEEKCREYIDKSPVIITAFLPEIGYEKATELIKEFYSNCDENVRKFLERKLGKEMVKRMLSPYKLTALGYKSYEQNAERE